jgi:hypothetical protein
VEDAQNAREFAIELLKVAAEVEHALMVQYLYTSTSVRPSESGEDYRTKLRSIAIQEMGHLATVQNLLLLLGGPQAFHMQRDVLRKSSDKNAIPFVLEPLTRTVLAKYVAAEMPASPPLVMDEKLKALLALAKADAGAEPNRVGAIYTVLEWMFMDEAEALQWMNLAAAAPLPAKPHLTDADLQAGETVLAHEALPEEWGDDMASFLLETTHSRAEAVKAIRLVAAQGEGLEDNPDSHFNEFVELVDACDQNKIAVDKIATSPDLGSGHGGERPVVISDPYTRRWGEVFSLQYTLLVLSIQHALATPRTTDEGAALRTGLAGLALRGMRRTIDPVAQILTKLPMGGGVAGTAGPPFDLDPAHLTFSNPFQMPSRHLVLLDRLEMLYRAIEAAPEFSAPEHIDHPTAIANLRNSDRRRRQLLEPLAVAPVA